MTRGVSVRGEGLCPGGSLSRESLSGGVSVRETPPYGNERGGTHPTRMHSSSVYCSSTGFVVLSKTFCDL